ncbi:putative aldehyde reductase [Monocercomonoides exilis]|uniref:putative aldehyde reductase n=1 Tax=Monocercomonoides exilis TaxID=2049356 RepID=UPI003559C7CC|nr:putative aldehyde reductase [Monocercomonoides exilis]|eukprot:MONOS_1176.1-p1 / transcript=MONOS_1176.1 / gene=MONOS_1176 / organism=Monocercomonoides_exilis_PA203 / gene_product=aldehyde reductase / transcript_product=aldehyde reductase / location=Mono_scaffold00020:46266-47328(-) / protein_length=312 / sequence_SO=supercontig / SO=protein_coding / is_pseudo=false
MATPIPMSTLKSGAKIPCVGLGTWEAPKGEVGNGIKSAIEAGYRHFDLAAVYGNEKECGEAFAEIFKSGIVKREDLWITSKLWNSEHRPERVLAACQKTLADLQLTYLDLYLIHWPVAHVPKDEPEQTDSRGFTKIDHVPIAATWAAMEELVAKGLVKHIGVSNFTVALLNDLLNSCKIQPEVNQIEMHPYNQQWDLVEYCQRQGIHCTAYSPLVRVGTVHGLPVNVMTDPVIGKIAEKHKKTPAQIAIRWQFQRMPNISVIPKSTKKERVIENFNVFDFALDDEDLKEIRALDRGFRVCQPIDFFGLPVFA